MYAAKVHSAPDVFKIEVPYASFNISSTNCYVVKDGDSALVVDTGAPTDHAFEVLSMGLDEIGANRREAAFFVTHLHFDHVGLIGRIATKGSKVYVHQNGRANTEGVFRIEDVSGLSERYLGEGIAPSDALAYAGCSSALGGLGRIDHRIDFVDDGDTIEVGRLRFEVVATPGHAREHMALYHPESGILFSGDQVLYSISPSICLPSAGEDTVEEYLGSLRRLQNLRCKEAFVAHGAPHGYFDERIGWLIEHHKKRLEEAVEIVERTPGLTGEEVIRRIRWNVPFGRWEDIPFSQRVSIVDEGVAVLDHLVREGCICRMLETGKPHRYSRP